MRRSQKTTKIDTMEKILFFTAVTTGLSIFYDFAMRDGMILAKWYELIDLLNKTRVPWLFNIMGGCVYCNNPYLTIAVMCAFNEGRQLLSLFTVIAIIAINHVLLRIFYRYVD